MGFVVKKVQEAILAIRLFVKLRSGHSGTGFNFLWTKLKLCTGNPENLKLYKHEIVRVKQVQFLGL